MDIKDVFAGVEEADRNERGQYIGEGVHKLEVKELKFITLRSPGSQGKLAFIAEHKVLESTAPDHIVGQTRTFYQAMDKPSPADALAIVRDYLAAASGLRKDELTQETCNGLVSEDQPLAGAVVRCDAWTQKTRAGGSFTLCKFSAE